MTKIVRVAWNAGAVLGEGPAWCAAEQALYWVDIRRSELKRYSPADEASYTWRLPEAASCVFPDGRGGWLAALPAGLSRLSFEGDQISNRLIVRRPDEAPGLRFNDGKVAPDGAIWIGTMDDAEEHDGGAWWRFSAGDRGASKVDGGYRVTNGPAFDPSRRRTYVTDSAKSVIYQIDGWNDGCAETKRVFKRFGPQDGYPDGMTIDAEGRLWVAFWDGGCVRALDPESADIVEQIDLPARRPTSCAFGGAGLQTLFVTSAATGLEPDSERFDGALFAINAGYRGVAEPKVRETL